MKSHEFAREADWHPENPYKCPEHENIRRHLNNIFNDDMSGCDFVNEHCGPCLECRNFVNANLEAYKKLQPNAFVELLKNLTIGAAAIIGWSVLGGTNELIFRDSKKAHEDWERYQREGR